MEISFVIPVYNETENVTLLVKKLEETVKYHYKFYEFIFVDDGSTDGTTELLLEISKEKDYVKPVFFAKNAGQTDALAAGFKVANGDIVVSLDGDLQSDPFDIYIMIPHLKEYDMVNGIRKSREDGVIRKLSSVIGNGFRNWVTGDNITDTGCPIKVFKKEVVKSFYLYKGMHRFLPTIAKINGFKVTEVPVTHQDRIFGKSKYGVFNRMFVGFADVIAVRWMKKRRLTYAVETKTK